MGATVTARVWSLAFGVRSFRDEPGPDQSGEFVALNPKLKTQNAKPSAVTESSAPFQF
jgi:hypothetical protein